MSTITQYPVEAAGGPLINRIIDYPIEYQFIRYEYDDGGYDTNVQPCGMKRWGLEYEGLSAVELDTIVDHFNLAKHSTNDFSFANPQDGATYTGVKYERIEFPRHARMWALPLIVTLWKLL